MNISTIEHYVERKNSWAKLFGSKEVNLLNGKDRQAIMNSLIADMSPENLTCDGELSNRDVEQRYRYLNRAAQELLSIDPNLEQAEYY